MNRCVLKHGHKICAFSSVLHKSVPRSREHLDGPSFRPVSEDALRLLVPDKTLQLWLRIHAL